jgi:diaminopimelate decarboxylase
VDLDAVGAAINPDLDALRSEPRFASAQLALETGRYLVGEAGFYLTRVLRIKHSRGTDICICDGGMNHHLGAAGHLGSVLQRNYRMFKLMGNNTGDAQQPYNLVGPLCTTIDTLARQVSLPRLEPGDVIVIRSSGAYGLTASPIHFIGHAPPKEIIVETVDGHLTVEDVSQIQSERTGRPP